MVSPAEGRRRAASRWDGELRSLPILVLSVHSACNCRCVMCDIWKANADKRELSLQDLERHVAGIRRLHVQRVMLTGGEPLLHSNLWALCDTLRTEGIRITLVTTGMLIEKHAGAIARTIDEIVVSIDGPPDVHDAVRRVRGGFDRIARGAQALGREADSPRTIARCVVQRANHSMLADTVDAIRAIGIDRVSFLAADVSSIAFNRPEGWSAERAAEIAVPPEQLPALARSVVDVEARCRQELDEGVISGGSASLWRIYDYYSARAGLRSFPAVTCNAPWVSAVLEPGDRVRPCFFHPPYASVSTGLNDAVNSPQAIEFRRSLNVTTDDTCRRCVCTLSLPLLARA